LSSDFSNAIEKAKQAVKDLEDPYKIPAFTTILSRLLITPSESIIPIDDGIASTDPKRTKEKRSVEQGKPGPRSWIKELIDGGFFKTPKRSKEILDALNERGHSLSAHNITAPLAFFVTKKLLRRKSMKPVGEDEVAVHWVNWG
jgi:hypothetical protein